MLVDVGVPCFKSAVSEFKFQLDLAIILAVLLVAMCKMLEFQMSARVLKQLSAFELKAWLGITLFASYFTDILSGLNSILSN